MSEQLLADARALRLFAEQNEHQFPLARQALAVTAAVLAHPPESDASRAERLEHINAHAALLRDYDAQELAAKLAAEDAEAERAFEAKHATAKTDPAPALVKHAPAKAPKAK